MARRKGIWRSRKEIWRGGTGNLRSSSGVATEVLKFSSVTAKALYSSGVAAKVLVSSGVAAKVLTGVQRRGVKGAVCVYSPPPLLQAVGQPEAVAQARNVVMAWEWRWKR